MAINETENPAISFGPNDLKQDEDVLDTWFSSWLWPISTFNAYLNPTIRI
jgi:valyl-tRNA synthetase